MAVLLQIRCQSGIWFDPQVSFIINAGMKISGE
jgi:hypothetical protein